MRVELPARELYKQAGLVLLAPLLPVLVDHADAAAVAGAVGVVAAMGFVAAGVAMLVTWKITGRAAAGWMGIGLVDLGLLSVARYVVGNISSERGAGVDSVGKVLVAVVAASAVICAARSPDVVSCFRPLPVMVASVFVGLCLLAVLERTVPNAYADPGWQRVAAAACAGIWLVPALWAVAATGRARRVRRLAVAPVMILVAVGSLVDAGVASRAWGPAGDGAGSLAAASLAVVAALWQLRRLFLGQELYVLDLRKVLDSTRAALERERVELDSRLHDLRNAVAAVRIAETTLRVHASVMDEGTRSNLADAMGSELERLQVLIEPGRRLDVSELSLADAIAPIVSLERARGSVILLDLSYDRVRGDGHAVAQIVQNLLANARSYAAGSPVVVRSRRIADKVELSVSDSGPGVPQEEQLAIFGRGARGSTSSGTSGSGIGLFTASGLAAGMGGRLTLGRSGRGACFVVELPGGGVVEVEEAAGAAAGM